MIVCNILLVFKAFRGKFWLIFVSENLWCPVGGPCCHLNQQKPVGSLMLMNKAINKFVAPTLNITYHIYSVCWFSWLLLPLEGPIAAFMELPTSMLTWTSLLGLPVTSAHSQSSSDPKDICVQNWVKCRKTIVIRNLLPTEDPSFVKMEILREFLESSTIHGLSYISSSKVRPDNIY